MYQSFFLDISGQRVRAASTHAFGGRQIPIVITTWRFSERHATLKAKADTASESTSRSEKNTMEAMLLRRQTIQEQTAPCLSLSRFLQASALTVIKRTSSRSAESLSVDRPARKSSTLSLRHST